MLQRPNASFATVFAVITLFCADLVGGCNNDSDENNRPDADAENSDADSTNDGDADGDTDGGSDADADADESLDADMEGDHESPPDADADVEPLPDGDRVIAGQAYFFDAVDMSITQIFDVAGAEVFVFEDPSRRVPVDDEGYFSLEGLPDGRDITLALDHEDYFPMLTATVTLDGQDIDDITFQAVSNQLAELAGLLLGVDPFDPAHCQMATTICAISDNQDTIWAVGEPGATVSLTPDPETDPVYFNTSVMPEGALTATTTDGGVIVVNAPPGIYTWQAHKEGYTFREMRTRCAPGFATNAAPPWGVQALTEPSE